MASWEDQLPDESKLATDIGNIDLDAPAFVPDFCTKPAVSIGCDSTNPPSRLEATDDVLNGDNAAKVAPTPTEPPKRKGPAIDVSKMKETINMVFIGHVDAGKSTIGGNLLHLTGMVDKRTLDKFEREAKDKGRESWYLSWALDTNAEERDKGKTVECGRGYFETATRQFVLVDAPGHKSFVPNMISGAAIADLAILVISARKGEFETGFEKGGQTREHAMLVKTIGVKRIIVLINKMDDPTVEWSEARFNECRDRLLPFLKKVGFNPKTDIYILPCSGLTGLYLKEPATEDVCPWYRGPSLLQYLDQMPPFERSIDAPFRFPIAEKFKDMGTYVGGKIESGQVAVGEKLIMMPNRVSVEISSILDNEIEVSAAIAGSSCKLKLKNIEEEDISLGFVLCAPEAPCQVASVFDAQVVVMDYKSIICPGFACVLHLHTGTNEVRIKALICRLDKKTGEKKDIRPRFIKQDEVAIIRFEVLGGSICMEVYKDYPQMGRFTLRDEGITLGVGKILKILPPKDSGHEMQSWLDGRRRALMHMKNFLEE